MFRDVLSSTNPPDPPFGPHHSAPSLTGWFLHKSCKIYAVSPPVVSDDHGRTDHESLMFDHHPRPTVDGSHLGPRRRPLLEGEMDIWDPRDQWTRLHGEWCTVGRVGFIGVDIWTPQCPSDGVRLPTTTVTRVTGRVDGDAFVERL